MAQDAMGIGERLKQLRGNATRDEMAARLGISRNTLARYEQGERLPDAAVLARVCAATGADAGWLLNGEAGVGALNDEFALVPLYSVEVSAGFGAEIDQEDPVSRLAFRHDWLSQMGLRATHVVAVTAKGDSMEPTLDDGDLLLVDTAQRTLVNDAVYVIRQESLLYVKRLQRLFDGGVRINSDNTAYAPEVIPAERVRQLAVIGRVVWAGGRL